MSRVLFGASCWGVKHHTKWINYKQNMKTIFKPTAKEKFSAASVSTCPLVSLTGWNHSSLADALPDPIRWHAMGLAVLLGLGQRVRGRAGVVVLNQVAVVRHKIALQLVVVLHGGGQEELHTSEDVQQRLWRKPVWQCEYREPSRSPDGTQSTRPIVKLVPRIITTEDWTIFLDLKWPYNWFHIMK